MEKPESLVCVCIYKHSYININWQFYWHLSLILEIVLVTTKVMLTCCPHIRRECQFNSYPCWYIWLIILKSINFNTDCHPVVHSCKTKIKQKDLQIFNCTYRLLVTQKKWFNYKLSGNTHSHCHSFVRSCNVLAKVLYNNKSHKYGCVTIKLMFYTYIIHTC